MPPCTLIVAMMYAQRLRNQSSTQALDYLKDVASSDLLLVSMVLTIFPFLSLFFWKLEYSTITYKFISFLIDKTKSPFLLIYGFNFDFFHHSGFYPCFIKIPLFEWNCFDKYHE